MKALQELKSLMDKMSLKQLEKLIDFPGYGSSVEIKGDLLDRCEEEPDAVSGLLSDAKQILKNAQAQSGGDWSWNVDWENGADEEDGGDFEEGDTGGLAPTLEAACKAISKEIDVEFTMNQLEFVTDDQPDGGALFADVFTGDMNYNIMIEGPPAEIKKLIKEKKVKS